MRCTFDYPKRDFATHLLSLVSWFMGCIPYRFISRACCAYHTSRSDWIITLSVSAELIEEWVPLMITSYGPLDPRLIIGSHFLSIIQSSSTAVLM
jgi:hypothetical protein